MYRFSRYASLLIIIIMVSSYIAHIQCSVRFTHITTGHWTCSFMHLSFSCAIKSEAIAAILILSLIFHYCHNILEAVVSDLWASHCISRGVFECLHWFFFSFGVLLGLVSDICPEISGYSFKTLKQKKSFGVVFILSKMKYVA